MGRRGDEEEEEEEGGESHACLCVRPFGPSQEEKQEGLRAQTPPPPYHLRARQPCPLSQGHCQSAVAPGNTPGENTDEHVSITSHTYSLRSKQATVSKGATVVNISIFE